jgi:hypothetical protein
LGNLRRHIKAKHEARIPNFKCDVCDKGFGDRGTLSRHRKSHERNRQV